MLKNSKLTMLFEGLMTRYRIGSFLVGDQIKFLDSIKSHEAYKKLAKADLELLDSMIEQEKNGDAIIKIVSINKYPMTQDAPGNPESFDIGIDAGGGRYMTVLNLPSCLINAIERVDTDNINLPATIAPNNKFTYGNNPETIEITSNEEEGFDELTLPKRQKVHKMPKSNVSIPGKTAQDIDYKNGIESTLDAGGKIQKL